jgi:hypothetical protein
MKFVLAGFHQNENVRRYSFQGIGDDRRTRIEFSVGVDLTLLYKHRIPLQEAPLLCCLLLSARVGSAQLHNSVSPGRALPLERDFVFPEEDLLVHAEQLARERAPSQTDRKPRPFAFRGTPTPILIDSSDGRSGIGLGSRAALPLTNLR